MPLVYYLGIINTQIPKQTQVLVLILCIAVGSIFIPKDQQTYQYFVKT